MTGTNEATDEATRGLVVAIDGPSGSGKSTIGRHLARHYGLAYLDTGAMYRALAWWALERGLSLADPSPAVVSSVDAAVAELALDLPLEEPLDPDDQAFRVAGTDVTSAIRTSGISTVVSRVATNLAVRAALRDRQRAIIARETTPDGWSSGRGIVAEGRDITTVVAPDAQVRILLTASEEVRMSRRAAELAGHDAAATGAQLRARDRADSKVVDFLNAAEGVTLVDSTELDFGQTIDAVISVIRAADER